MHEADPSHPLAPAPRGPVALIYSAHAGRAHTGRPHELLDHAGVEVALSLPVDALDTRALQGQRWRDAGCVAAVAAGGDGTVGAVATHAVSAGLPVGILPMGTANDIARALQIPMSHPQAAEVIAHGALHTIDAGQALTTQPPTSEQEGQSAAYFLHAMTLGLNVEFARLATDVKQREAWGRMTYLASAIESLERLIPTRVTLRFSGMPGAQKDAVFALTCETALLTAINLPVFGGRLGLRVPGIHTSDRLLDFIIFETSDPTGVRDSFETALGALARAAHGLWTPHGAPHPTLSNPAPHPVLQPGGMALPGARWLRASAVEIESAHPVQLTIDGEICGQTPAVARVAPTPVQMIVPVGSHPPPP